MSPIGDSSELVKIIREGQLNAVFQPIVDLHFDQVHGYEALIRGPSDSTLHSPLALFDTAHKNNLMSELEYACQQTSCRSFKAQNGQGKLFLNVSPMGLMESCCNQAAINKILDQLQIPADRVVIEVSEQYPLEDYNLIREVTNHFRELGFQIAIDDLGAGYAGLRSWSEIRPEYVKIDRHFINHINEDPVKREFVRSIQEIATELDCKVVAEGIETEEELNTIRLLGIRFGQGYLLGRPEAALASEAQVVSKLKQSQSPSKRVERMSMPISDLAQNSPVVSPDLSMSEVFELLSKNIQLGCLPVIEQGKPVGMIERQSILELFSSLYARELHGKKPVREFMDSNTVIVEGYALLEDVSRLLTKNEDEYLSQHFLVTENGQYFGLGYTSKLFKKITEQQIRSARYANPLTLLPGNVPIHEKMEDKIKSKANFHVAYFDLNNFKPFNDYFGYSKGDDVLALLSHLMQKVIISREDFIGHIGGDDFVVIFDSHNWKAQCEDVVEQFSTQVVDFYQEEEVAAGGIWSANRQGEEQFFELLSLVVGVVHPDPESCLNYHDIAALAVDAKMQAKRVGGNCVFYSRRRRPDTGKLADAMLSEPV